MKLKLVNLMRLKIYLNHIKNWKLTSL